MFGPETKNSCPCLDGGCFRGRRGAARSRFGCLWDPGSRQIFRRGGLPVRDRCALQPRPDWLSTRPDRRPRSSPLISALPLRKRECRVGKSRVHTLRRTLAPESTDSCCFGHADSSLVFSSLLKSNRGLSCYSSWRMVFSSVGLCLVSRPVRGSESRTRAGGG